MKISTAANTIVPAYLALVQSGFQVSQGAADGSEPIWTAVKGDLALSAEGPLELLALVKLVEVRGTAWKASDSEIEGYISRFCTPTG